MKRLLFMMALAIFAFGSVNAQTATTKSEKGIYIGGGITFESTSDETAIAIIPEIGYKLKDNWGLGVRLGYGSQGSGDSKYTIFSIKPYARQNLLSFGQINVILDYTLLYESAGIKDNKTNTLGIGISPGLAVNLNKKISVVTHLGFVGYTSAKLDVEGAEAVNTFTLNANAENLGLSVYYNF